jgi:hypothetical protein
MLKDHDIPRAVFDANGGHAGPRKRGGLKPPLYFGVGSWKLECDVGSSTLRAELSYLRFQVSQVLRICPAIF